MADQLSETEAHLAKLQKSKKILGWNITELQNKINTGKEMLLDHPYDEALEHEVADDNRRWRTDLYELEKKRKEIDNQIVQVMDEIKRLRLRNN